MKNCVPHFCTAPYFNLQPSCAGPAGLGSLPGIGKGLEGCKCIAIGEEKERVQRGIIRVYSILCTVASLAVGGQNGSCRKLVIIGPKLRFFIFNFFF
jgi:hypothetical protein